MKTIYSYIILFSIIITSCTGTQNTASSGDSDSSENETELTKEEEREKVILSEGYSKCEVMDLGSEDGCGFVLQDLTTEKLYKPVQWEGEFAAYKKAGNVVYIKYRGSKVAQTVCLQSMPILLDEMKLVE